VTQYGSYEQAAYDPQGAWSPSNQIKSNLFCHKFSTQYNNEFALRLAGQTGDNFALMSAFTLFSNSNSNSCICSAPSTISPMAHSIFSGRSVLSWTEMSLDDAWVLLSTTVDRMSFSSVGNRFHTRGAATENARSPNRRYGRGRKRLPLLEARSDERVGMSATGVSRSEM